ncbi:MAG: hypothetical protein JXA28_03340, partial [Bacteroidetes bacterium]|nr:hypothetical protein [Bacteroidota bacterium]
TIYVAGGNPNNGDSHIYRIDPDGTVNTWLRLTSMLVMNTWFLRDTLYVTAGKMIYQLAKEKTNLVWEVTEAAGLITDVEMSAANNIVAVTEKNTFLHYNGSTWKEMPFAYPKPVYATDLAVFDKHVYIVGYTPEQYCLIMHGTRL